MQRQSLSEASDFKWTPERIRRTVFTVRLELLHGFLSEDIDWAPTAVVADLSWRDAISNLPNEAL